MSAMTGSWGHSAWIIFIKLVNLSRFLSMLGLLGLNETSTLCLTSERAELFSMFLLSRASASCWASRSCCSVFLNLSGRVSSSLSRPSSSRLTCSFSLSRLTCTSSASFCTASSFRQYSSDSSRACWTCKEVYHPDTGSISAQRL